MARLDYRTKAPVAGSDGDAGNYHEREKRSRNCARHQSSSNVAITIKQAMPVAVVLCLAWSTSALIMSPHHIKMRATTSSLQSVATPSRSAALSPVSRVPAPRMTFDLASSYSAALSEHYYPSTCRPRASRLSLLCQLATCWRKLLSNRKQMLPTCSWIGGARSGLGCWAL